MLSSVLLAVAVIQVGVPAEPALVLEEVAAIPLPGASPIIGVDGLDASTLVVWGRGPNDVGVIRNGEYHSLDFHRRPAPVAARMVDATSVELVVGDELVRLSTRDGAIESRQIPGRPEEGTPVFGSGDWYQPSASPGGDIQILRFSWEAPELAPSARLRLSSEAGGDRVEARSHWSEFVRVGHVGPKTLVLGQMGSPFKVARMEVSPGARRAYEWLTPGITNAAGAWVASALLPVKGFLLQQLVDLRSDRRRFVLYDEDSGAHLRSTEITAPLTILAKLRSAEDLVAAVRTTGGRALIIYRVQVGSQARLNE